jgi:hypothetical protein
MSEDYKGHKWKKLPDGWTKGSRRKFWDSLVGDSEHPVTTCMEKMEGKDGIDDPGAFCAALRDRVDGTTKWRGDDKKKDKKASNGVVSLQPNMSPLQIAQLMGNHLTKGPGRLTGRILVLDPNNVLESANAHVIHDMLYDQIMDDAQEDWQKARSGYYDRDVDDEYRKLVHDNLEIKMTRLPISSSREGWDVEITPTVDELEDASRTVVQTRATPIRKASSLKELSDGLE